MHTVQSSFCVVWQILRANLVFDKYAIAITTVFILCFVPLIPRATENAQKLAAFINDEPALTMGLEAMTVRPYGNPGNFYGRPGYEPKTTAALG